MQSKQHFLKQRGFALAHFGQISTARITQIMWLDNLAPDIQEEILFLPRTNQGRDPIKEADIRSIAKTLDWNKQRQMWNRLRKSTIGLQGKTNSSKFSATVGSQLDAAGLASEASAASFSP